MSAQTLLKVLPTEHNTEGIFEELKDIQENDPQHYLPTIELERVAERRGLHLRDVHAIASYYPQFHLKPPARVDVKVCDDMSCHLRGAPALLSKLKQRFPAARLEELSKEELSKLEQRFPGTHREELSIGTTSCLGRCDHAPSFVINGTYYDGFSAQEAVDTVAQIMAGRPRAGSAYLRVVDSDLKTDPYDRMRPYKALRRYIETGDWEDLIARMKAANLRGMGGAGFPTHDKWIRVRNSPPAERYLVCNADESEPGTLKDRFILTHLPHLVIEGMILAGLCLKARRGYLYLRHEYHEQRQILLEELDRCAKDGLLGEGILGHPDLSFNIVVFESPGGYICGEETALLEAIEGKRAEPRNKPPFLANVGLWGKPTIVNNPETLAFVTAIAHKGPGWWYEHGANGCKGLKFAGISGDVERPGVYEVPMGIKYSDLIREYGRGALGGRRIIAFAPSGPSSGFLPASMLDLPMDWDALRKAGSMVGSSAVVVVTEGRCMLDMAFNAVRFYRNESCGKCVPCRIGSQKLVDLLERWMQGGYRESDLKTVEELSQAAVMTSICGLGQVLPVPIQSVLKHFRADLDEHFINRHCPAGVCFRGGRA